MECPRCGGKNSDISHFCGQCGVPLRQSDQTVTRITRQMGLDAGTMIARKYRIIEKIGAGGMGEVFKATDTRLLRDVALKFLPREMTLEAEYTERFLQEAQACSKLDHPNVCTIYEIGETEDGRMFIAMAFCEGETLKSRIKRGPLPIEEAVNISRQIGQGLLKAHALGIVHRDIKPGNVILTSDGIVKILDFGLAKIPGKKLTRTDAVMGTVSYMSPEQAKAEPVTLQSDIWSLGIVLYEMLTGRLPFEGEQAESVIYAICHLSPQPPTDLIGGLPKSLEQVVYKCLQVDLKTRYASLRRFLIDLDAVTRGSESAVSPGPAAAVEQSGLPKEAERRMATVMVLEVTGVSGLFEKLDIEDAASIMKDFHSMVGTVEQRYEGRIKKITDYSFVFHFGIPRAIENAPKKAVNAAIELRNRLTLLQRDMNLKTPLHLHIGINTGMVVTGSITARRQDELTVMGDAVTLAFQLKAHADEGKILVGPQTYRSTRKDFDYKSVKPLILQGKKAPVPVYELLSHEEQIFRSVQGAERMIHSAMVGRDQELDKLKLHVFKVINGEGSILNIIGEAGIGKSRLLRELLNLTEMAKVHFLKGRALSIGKNLSFHPLIDMLKNWCGIQDRDSLSTSLSRLESTIGKIHPEGRDEIVPFIATLMGMKLSSRPAERVRGIEGEALTKLILKNLRELLGKAAEKKPVVFVIEDLHWADLTSIEFLESLYRLSESHRILFVNVFRPGYEETGERIRRTIGMRYRKRLSEILLDYLDESCSEILIHNLLKIPSLPAGLRELIIKRTGGNPFFIEEVVRSLIDEGTIEVRGGEFRVTSKIDDVVVPETINEVLMGRMDKLDEETRSLLRIASVIGRNFFYKILAEVTGGGEELNERLELLKEIQLILERKRMGELEFLFKHALAQEAVYESILLKTRKRLHLRIAEAIELVFADRLREFFGMLALHFSKGEDPGKAETYLIKAGEEALKSSASSEALNYYKEALSLYLRQHGANADAGQIAMLEKNIAIALFNKGQYVEADEYFTKTLAHYGEKFPRRRIMILLKFISGFLSFLLKLYIRPLRRRKPPSPRDGEVIDLLYKKNTALIILNTERMFIESFYWLSRLFNYDLTKLENGAGIISMSGAAFSYGGLSFRLSRRVREYVRDKIDLRDKKSKLYFKLPELLLATFSGRWEEIENFDQVLVESNIGIGELFYTTAYIMTHGYYRIAKGDYAFAMELSGMLNEVAEVYENDNARAASYWYKTQVLVNFRRLDQALEAAEKGIEFTSKKGFKPYLFSLYSFKARIHTQWDQFPAAETALKNAEDLESEVKIAPYILSTYLISHLHYNLIVLENGDMSPASPIPTGFRKKTARLARKSVRCSRKSPADIPEAYKLRGVYEWIRNRRKKALRWWEKGIAEAERLGARLELGRIYHEMGRRLAEGGNGRRRATEPAAAYAFLRKARELYLELGLEDDLDQLTREMPEE